MSTIFVSHSSGDDALARALELRLRERNHHSVFLDLDPEKGIIAGQSWERTLYAKLRSCRIVIALCTDRYLDSHWCFAEIALARMEGKQIIALKADPLAPQAALPAILVERQFIDLREEPERGFERLWRALDQLDVHAGILDWDPRTPPYPGLSAYQESHAPVFFGREDEVQSGLELLERGAPGLFMVLGASGSGKSSLVRAGMIPRLRAREQSWVVVEPFRPGPEPMAELAESLTQCHRSFATGHAITEIPSAQSIANRLNEWTHKSVDQEAGAGVDNGSGPEAPRPAPPGGESLRRLLDVLETLRGETAPQLGSRARSFLNLTLDELQRIASGDAASRPVRADDATPLIDIAHDLCRAAGRRDARVLIILDQFEELLEATDRKARSARFLALLRASIEAEASPVVVLATLRSDFLGSFQRCAEWQGIDFESLSLGPVTAHGMRRVIESPARLATVELEEGFADRLLADAETSDALPLLSFTLWVLWRNHRDDGRFRIADYEALGGLHGAIAQEADAVLASATRGGNRDALRRAFLRMARLTGSGLYARLPMRWDEPEIRAVHDLLERLVQRRVLVSRSEGDRPIVEVAHEALFRTWRPLRDWLDNARTELLLRQQLERDAAVWQEQGRAPDYLWRASRLLEAQELLGTDKTDEGAGDKSPVAAFVRAGLRRQRRLRVVTGAVALSVFVTLAGFLAYALDQARIATEEKVRALDLARVALAGEWLDKNIEPTRAALMLLEVQDPEGTPFAARRFGEALEKAFVTTEYRHDGPVHSARMSPDGRFVLTASGARATIWETMSGARVRSFEHEHGVIDAMFDPSGALILTRAGERGDNYAMDRSGDVAEIWNATTGEHVLRIEQDLSIATFAPRGERLLTVAGDQSVQLWTLSPQIESRSLAHPDRVVDAAFSPGGRVAVTVAGRIARLWNVETGELLRSVSHERSLDAAAFSPDGAVLVTVGSHSTRIWDAATGRERQRLEQGGRAVSMDPDGRRFLVTARNAVEVYSLPSGRRELMKPIEHAGLRYAAFSNDGAHVVTVASHADRRAYGVTPPDNAIRYWDVRSGSARAIRELRGHGEVMSVSFGPRSRQVVARSGTRVLNGRGETMLEDSTVRLWRVDIAEPRLAWTHDRPVGSIAFVGGDRLVLATGTTATIHDVQSGEPVHTLPHEGAVSRVASAPGGRVVTASEDGTARVWDVRTGAETFRATHAACHTGRRCGADCGGFAPRDPLGTHAPDLAVARGRGVRRRARDNTRHRVLDAYGAHQLRPPACGDSRWLQRAAFRCGCPAHGPYAGP